MDVETIDRTYNELQTESQSTAQAISGLAQKLQAAAQAGNADARDWILDLKEIAVNLRDEQNKVGNLLQSLHDFVVNQLNTTPQQPPQYQMPPPQYQAPQYQAPQYQPQYQQPAGYQGGGVLHRFLGGGFGQAIAMGAGFGIGDDIINSIF